MYSGVKCPVGQFTPTDTFLCDSAQYGALLTILGGRGGGGGGRERYCMNELWCSVPL